MKLKKRAEISRENENCGFTQKCGKMEALLTQGQSGETMTSVSIGHYIEKRPSQRPPMLLINRKRIDTTSSFIIDTFCQKMYSAHL